MIGIIRKLTGLPERREDEKISRAVKGQAEASARLKVAIRKSRGHDIENMLEELLGGPNGQHDQ